jgi:hypothetical protein
MKLSLISPVLPVLIIACLVAVFSSALGYQALARQITFVQGNQPRNQGQNQQGLSPEKKKSLSKYGPEDAFPNTEGQENSRRQNSRPAQRSQTASSSRPAPTPAPSATPVAMPSLTLATPPPASPSPTANAAAASGRSQQPPPISQAAAIQSADEWTVPVLSGLALVVSVALIYVLTKLREKIREG